MALLEDTVEGLFESGTGLAIVGVGALLLAPGLLPAVGRMIRPLAVGAIKAGMTVYDQAASSLREATGDLVAEARTELETNDRAAQAGPEPRRGRAAEAQT